MPASSRRAPLRPPRTHARAQGVREPKGRFVVVTEGQATEPEYLKQLESSVNALVTIRPVAPNLDPMGLAREAVEALRTAKKLRAIEKGDEFWCMLDVDNFGAQIARAVALANEGGVSVVVSNPCFEVWLLGHFTFSSAQRSPSDMADAVGAHIKGYGSRNKHLPDGLLMPLYPTARKNALLLDKHHESAGNSVGSSPSTDVYRLVDRVHSVSGTT